MVNDDIKDILRRVRENGHTDLTIQQVRLPNGLTLGGVEINTAEDRRLFRQTVNDLATLYRAPRNQFVEFAPGQPPALPPTPAPVPAPPAGPSLSECIANYLSEMTRVKRAVRNVMDTKYTLELFLALGGDKPIRDVTTQDVRDFLNALTVYPANASKNPAFKGMTPLQVLEAAKKGDYPRLLDRTQEKRRDHLAAFFNLQAAEDLIPKAPHKALMNRSKALTDAPSREPFSPAELATLFDLDAFIAWASKYPHRWFGTLLGVSTGARVNEVAQLYADDVAQVGGHWGIHIRAQRPDQRLKNTHSSRFVPLPRAVLDAGFLTFVDEVRSAGFERLFPHLQHSEASGYGDALGDQFRDYAIKRGLTERLKSFHCFRHNVPNTLINELGWAHTTVQEITGHDLTLPPGLKHYVNPGTVERRLAALDAFGPPVPLPLYTPGQFARSFKQVAHIKRRREKAAKTRQAKKSKAPA